MRVGRQTAGGLDPETGRPKRYLIYVCRGGGHVTARLEYLDSAVTKLVIAWLSRSDFLTIFGTAGLGELGSDRMPAVRELQALTAEFEAVSDKAARTQDIQLLLGERDRLGPLLEEAAERVCRLTCLDRHIVDLALRWSLVYPARTATRDNSDRDWEALSLFERRTIIRTVFVPVVDRAGQPGRRGFDPARISRSVPL